MLITVSGLPGSGTTTASRAVGSLLGIEVLPGGEVFRAMAAEQRMSLAAFGVHAARHPEVDVELDTRLAARARKGDVVIESRLAGWIARVDRLPAVTTWVACAPDVRARRVADREGVSVARARADSTERQQVERDRYLELYGIHVTDLSVYDLVLDSGVLGADEIAARIAEAARQHPW